MKKKTKNKTLSHPFSGVDLFGPEKNGYGLTQPSGVYSNYPARSYYVCVWGPKRRGQEIGWMFTLTH